MLDQAANDLSTVEEYANLIATLDLIKAHPEHHFQGSWCSKNRYCFAGFAALLKEGKTVGDSIPDQDPDLADWLDMAQEDYDLICYRIDTTEEVLGAIESVLAGKKLYDSQGFDHAGYNAAGYNRNGYDVDGYGVERDSSNDCDETEFDADDYDF
jgi:hypothetical protein